MRADRLISLVLLLQTRGKATAAALAAELAVSTRTILRDVEALSLAGIPVYAEGGHGGGITLDEGYRTSLTGMKHGELQSLLVAGNAAILRDVGLGDAAESSTMKLMAALPAVHRPAVEHFRQRVYIDPLWWWHDSAPPAFWDALQTAVFEDRRIQVLYETHSRDISTRVLEPYGLVSKSSFWYLIARREGAFRTYRVARIHEATPLDERFERDRSFDLAAYWQSHLAEFTSTLASYEFTLRIDPARMNFVRRLTSGRVIVAQADADDVWPTVTLQVETPELARMLVFGLGGQAEVVAPESLREEVLREAAELLRLPRVTKR